MRARPIDDRLGRQDDSPIADAREAGNGWKVPQRGKAHRRRIGSLLARSLGDSPLTSTARCFICNTVISRDHGKYFHRKNFSRGQRWTEQFLTLP